jgi:hypothetical protein
MRNGWRDGSVIVIGDSGGDEQQWQQWVTTGVTKMGDSNSGDTILMGINGGGAMDGRTALTAQWQSP